MIVFYDNRTGEIIGNVEGRVHPEVHLEMWVGDRDFTSRIVCDWKQVEGSQDFEPDCSEDQKKVFVELDKDPSKVYNYKIDLKNKILVKK